MVDVYALCHHGRDDRWLEGKIITAIVSSHSMHFISCRELSTTLRTCAGGLDWPEEVIGMWAPNTKNSFYSKFRFQSGHRIRVLVFFFLRLVAFETQGNHTISSYTHFRANEWATHTLRIKRKQVANRVCRSKSPMISVLIFIHKYLFDFGFSVSLSWCRYGIHPPSIVVCIRLCVYLENVVQHKHS